MYVDRRRPDRLVRRALLVMQGTYSQVTRGAHAVGQTAGCCANSDGRNIVGFKSVAIVAIRHSVYYECLRMRPRGRSRIKYYRNMRINGALSFAGIRPGSSRRLGAAAQCGLTCENDRRSLPGG
jgi:hypothetical protein